MRYKIPNTQKSSSASNSVGPHSSGIYYGTVVSVESTKSSNEGLIKVSIPAFDSKSKIFCKENESKTLRTNNRTFNRVQGTGLNESLLAPTIGEVGTVPMQNQKQLDDLESRPRETNSNKVTNNSCIEVPYAVPLLPKHLLILPKVGEMCLVIVEDTKKPQQNRYWVGPLISDRSRLSYESSQSGGDLLNSNVLPSATKQTDDISKKGGFTGGFPEKFDIALQGRNNADIVLPTNKEEKDRLNKGGEVLIRAGKFNFNRFGPLELNKKNPGFLRIKVVENEVNPQNSSTHSMLYSDYISLVSYKNSDGSSGVPRIKKINPLLEKDKDLFNFHEALSPLVRGDVLVKFLRLLVDYIKNHNHPYHKLPATGANSKPEIEKFDLISLLSPHIRIN